MKKNILMLFFLFSLIATSSLKANWYVGGGISKEDSITYKPSGNSGSYRKHSPSRVDYDINIFGGYNINNFFALEGYFAYGLPEKYTYSFGDKDKDTYTKYFLYSNFKYPINKHIPFIKLGLGHIKYTREYTYNAGSYDIINKGLSYAAAIGYEYAISNNDSIMLSYNYFHMPKADLNSDGYKQNNYGNITDQNISLQYKYSFN